MLDKNDGDNDDDDREVDVEKNVDPAKKGKVNMVRTIICFGASLIIYFGSSGTSHAFEAKDCASFLNGTYSWVAADRQVAVQVSFNKTRGDSGHFSLTDGFLTTYEPSQYPEIESLIKRGEQGAFQPLPKFIMEGFEFKNIGSGHTRHGTFPTKRKDDIFLVLLKNGEVFIILRSWGNTVLPVKNLKCYNDRFIEPGFLMTGFMEEGNGTTILSFTLQMVEL